MKTFLLLLLINFTLPLRFHAQNPLPIEPQAKAISALIRSYATARENRDTALLKQVLTKDVNQLVSTGEWRNGIEAAVQGMLKSSTNNPGTRTLLIDKIRMLNSNCALVDCRYEIQNSDSTIRKMWSTFMVVADQKT